MFKLFRNQKSVASKTVLSENTKDVFKDVNAISVNNNECCVNNDISAIKKYPLSNKVGYCCLFDGEIINLRNVNDYEALMLIKEIDKYLKVYSKMENADCIILAKNIASGVLDPSFKDAVDIVMQYGRASMSFLQRKLGVGYTRTSKIIEQLKDHNIIGVSDGLNNCEVLISKQQWNQMWNAVCERNSNNEMLYNATNVDITALKLKLKFYEDCILYINDLIRNQSDETIVKIIDELKIYYDDIEMLIDECIVLSLSKITNVQTTLSAKYKIRSGFVCELNEKLNFARIYFGNVNSIINFFEFPNIIVENVDFKQFEFNIGCLMSRCGLSNSRFLLMNIGILKNMNKFNQEPYNAHLLIPVISNERKAYGAVGWAISEMLKRYSEFSSLSVYSIEEYNKYINEHDPKHGQLPYIFIVVDDLHNINSPELVNQIYSSLLELALKGKNAGIRLILGTSGKANYFKEIKQLTNVMSVVTMTGLETVCQGKCTDLTVEEDTIDGHEFEYVCADILRLRGYKNVNVTKGSGDQGVDVTAERDGIKYAVQCKYYSNPVGNTAVQEIYTGMQYYKAHVGIIMTNSIFTISAKELAEKLGVVLWDRDFLSPYLND